MGNNHHFFVALRNKDPFVIAGLSTFVILANSLLSFRLKRQRHAMEKSASRKL